MPFTPVRFGIAQNFIQFEDAITPSQNYFKAIT